MTPEQRQAFLTAILAEIRNGTFESVDNSFRTAFNSNPPAPGRQEYLPPYKRDSLNYGYMTSGEVGSGNKESL